MRKLQLFVKRITALPFPMMSKISVKGGDMHEVYHFLTEKEKNGLQDSEVGMEFSKIFVG